MVESTPTSLIVQTRGCEERCTFRVVLRVWPASALPMALRRGDGEGGEEEDMVEKRIMEMD